MGVQIGYQLAAAGGSITPQWSGLGAPFEAIIVGFTTTVAGTVTARHRLINR
jgi:hypothetical protein